MLDPHSPEVLEAIIEQLEREVARLEAEGIHQAEVDLLRRTIDELSTPRVFNYG